VVEGEEEIGSPHMPQFVEDNREKLQCHGAIWETGGTTIDGHPELWLGCRGVLAVELSVETLSKDAHSGSAHILPNAAWRLNHALASLKGADDRIRIAGFYDPAEAPNEADRRHLATLPDMEKRLREDYGVGDFVRGLSGADLRSAVFEPTCNIQGLQGGYSGQGMKTVIPAVAQAKLDFRLVPWQDPDDILAKLRAHLDREGFSDVVITKLGAMWPYKAEDDDPLVDLVRQSGEEVYRKPSVVTPLLGGSSPVYAFHRPLGIPVITAGIGYGMENRLHAPDEHIRIDDFLQGSRHIARIMARFGSLS
jgi:acetylornithine deacetylase/succinyl-diaminopimelate desuccinylase-like protein